MKLSLKLAVLITTLALVSSCVVAILSYQKNEKRVELRTDRSIISLVATVSSMASTSAYVKDPALADEVVSGLQLNDEIQCAQIITDEFRTTLSDDCRGEASYIAKLRSPWDNSEEVGEIRVYKSRGYVDAFLEEQFANEIRILVQVILVVSASILLMTHFIIALPIARVSTRLEGANFKNEIELLKEGERRDEIGNISRVINLMITNAKKQIITEKMVMLKTEELSNHFRLIFQLSKSNLAVTDTDLKLKSYNPTFKSMVSKVQDNPRLENSDSWIASVTSDPEWLRQLVAETKTLDQPVTKEVSVEFNDGDSISTLFYTLTFVKSRAEALGIAVLIFIYDMTEQRERLAQSEYEANHDNLTGLYNRLAATRKIRYILTMNEQPAPVAILFIDLDGFKSINDSLGHDAGDIVLKEIGQRLLSSVRKSDVACRWGGDEFLIALHDIGLLESKRTANKILKTILEPISLPDGQQCSVGASIGLALSSDEVKDFQTLYDHADSAMYKVKKSTKNAVYLHAS